ncbi:glutathione S-transferase C-terminal domain-containing protein homolog [Athalia rosae]|uniref:glutathione S-transferase C-terminal domain-containing protein homolog n=1 Tax=Athalia rosae TaxID=37344 RepID=UPI002033A29E|nr:glutathione S-transferase C-terminal domain-containing protein homolog [Athalia rosae]
MSTDYLYLRAKSIDDDNLCLAPIETLITLFTIQYCESEVNINLVLDEEEPDELSHAVDLSWFNYRILNSLNDVPYHTSGCKFPTIVVNEITYVAGLCATLRQIVKTKSIDFPHYSRSLLGFKDACLLSCSESSVWTRFCEVDLISSLKSPLLWSLKGDTSSLEIPASIARFEYQMSQPLRLHNLYKYTMSKKFAVGGIPTNDRSKLLEHVYAEGPYMTLADLIIFVCVHVFFGPETHSQNLLQVIPLITKWYLKIKESDAILESLKCFRFLNKWRIESGPVTGYILPDVEHQSLYNSDPKRYKPRNRIYTRQMDTDKSLKLIEELKVDICLDSKPFGYKIELDWNKIPLEATPVGGALPENRAKRKFEQLKNLCRPVIAIAKPADVIVDFCSGGGHLGILIAYLLPKCKVILLENKEESLNRAKERVKKLKLSNVKFYQCNLDYFKGHFDIGVSLHACGVATDLVIRQCLKQNAIFICCPCCYGSVHDCHHITYPRSEIFRKKIDTRTYLVLGHSADQTHDTKNPKTEQGYKCMSVIDTDRKLQAEEFGYVVRIGKLEPDNCTPKNHLLVGVPNASKNLLLLN